MVETNTLKQLRASLQPYALLYVEDNVGLNTQATALFQKLFDTVYSAYDGEEGLKLFQEHRPAIVITDIVMPKMDGLMMAESILKIDPEVKIIITTAHDDPDFLHKAIRVGIFDFLVKPLRIESLSETLERCAHELKEALHRKIFNTNLHTIFNYQNSLVILLQSQKVVMANQPCLDFFAAESVEKLRNRFEGFGKLLLEHSGFLYEDNGAKWFSAIAHDPGKLFNVKISDKNDKHHHFILRYQNIPEKEGYGVLSLNDVTELGLLKLYDANSVEKERLAKDEKMVRGLLEMAMRNGAKIRVHNLYKGLSITNDGLIAGIDEKVVLLKTPYVQLKAMQYEDLFYLTSELFPMAILCNAVKRIDFEAQSVYFNQYRMVQTSPTRRVAIRVVPDDNLTITLLYEGRKFESDIGILDISINATRLLLTTLPAGMALKQSVVLDIVLKSAGRPVIINTEAEVYRINLENNRYEVVCVYELHGSAQKNMIDYIAKRQMVLIREFKGMQYEK
jgi:CheY-like chemotaxis protein